MKPEFCSTCGSQLKMEMRDRERLVCSDETCDFVHWNNPIPVIGAIVQQDENVILVQSIGWPKNWYALVTGFLEAGETPEEGIVREVEEEIGLVPTEVNYIGIYPFHRMNQLLIIYHVKVDENATVKLQLDELADYKKVPIEEVFKQIIEEIEGFKWGDQTTYPRMQQGGYWATITPEEPPWHLYRRPCLTPGAPLRSTCRGSGNRARALVYS